MKIAIVIGSVREERISPRLAKWVQKTAKEAIGDHEWELVDLKEYDLPLFAEPMPPMANQRPELADGTKRYLEAMGSADGFIFVTAEHNHGMPASLKNAIDLIDYQLMKKPAAIVSHGVVGGARANEQVRLVVNSNLGAVPVPNTLTFSGRVDGAIDEDGNLAEGNDVNEQALHGVIDALVWYADALKTAREK